MDTKWSEKSRDNALYQPRGVRPAPAYPLPIHTRDETLLCHVCWQLVLYGVWVATMLSDRDYGRGWCVVSNFHNCCKGPNCWCEGVMLSVRGLYCAQAISFHPFHPFAGWRGSHNGLDVEFGRSRNNLWTQIYFGENTRIFWIFLVPILLGLWWRGHHLRRL